MGILLSEDEEIVRSKNVLVRVNNLLEQNKFDNVKLYSFNINYEQREYGLLFTYKKYNQTLFVFFSFSGEFIDSRLENDGPNNAHLPLKDEHQRLIVALLDEIDIILQT